MTSTAPLDRTQDGGEEEGRVKREEQQTPWGRLVPLVGGGEGPVDASLLPKQVDLLPDEPPLLFGRAPDCDPRCQFGDKRVSGHHCRVYRERDEGGQWHAYLHDLSSNGTFVNGSRVGKGSRVRLSGGDEIALTNLSLATASGGVTRLAWVFQDLTDKSSGPDEDNPATQEIPTNDDSSTSSCSSSDKRPNNLSDRQGTNKRKVEDQTQDDHDDTERDKKKLRKLEETYEDSLLCGICQEMLHKCVALFPCMHNFCAYCYGEWRDRGNKECPQCRTFVQGLSKNHTICSLIESFLEANPDKARNPDDIRDMDMRSKITDEMLRQVITYKSKKSSNDDSRGDDEDEEDESEEDEEEDTPLPPRFVLPLPRPISLFGGFFGSGGISGGYRTVCRECGTASATDGFKCPTDSAPHNICSACGQPFPDRGDRCPVAVKCELCDKFFCDLYLSRGGSAGCPLGGGKFKKLSGHTFTSLPPASFNSNPVEQEIMTNYLTAKGKTVTDLWLDCLAAVDSGAITFNGFYTRKNLHSGLYACEPCAQYAFQNVVYFHRANMPPAEFPSTVTSRPDCHWGKNCRTQQHNPGHAKRYNHVCEQTRF